METREKLDSIRFDLVLRYVSTGLSRNKLISRHLEEYEEKLNSIINLNYTEEELQKMEITASIVKDKIRELNILSSLIYTSSEYSDKSEKAIENIKNVLENFL